MVALLLRKRSQTFKHTPSMKSHICLDDRHVPNTSEKHSQEVNRKQKHIENNTSRAEPSFIRIENNCSHKHLCKMMVDNMLSRLHLKAFSSNI